MENPTETSAFDLNQWTIQSIAHGLRGAFFLGLGALLFNRPDYITIAVWGGSSTLLLVAGSGWIERRNPPERTRFISRIILNFVLFAPFFTYLLL